MILLPGLLPAPAHMPMWAVFAGEDGEPLFEPVICFGVFEVDEKGRRLVSAFTQGDHIESADFKEGFVAITRDVVEYDSSPGRWGPSVAEWAPRCEAKRAEINDAKAQQKIIVPNGAVAQGVFGSN